MEWFESLVLGAVQGLTEFLPVSSDGHLSITQQAFAQWTGRKHTGAENLFFDVMLHVGTLAAIIVYFRPVWITGAKGLLLDSQEVPPSYRRPAVVRTGLLAAVATTPLIPLALFLKKWIDKTFESTAAAGIGFLITAAVLLLTYRLQNRGEGGKGPAETTWLDALLIGIAQMFAPLPGVSRSGLTVAAALTRGLSRAWAVGFSLLIAVPAILGATVFEVRKLDPKTLTGDRVAQIATAATLAAIVGYGAIIWLVKVVRSGKLWYFSVYLVLLGLIVLAASAAMDDRERRRTSTTQGAPADARRETAADRPIRGGGARRADPTRGEDVDRVEPLDRAHAAGQGAGDRGAGANLPSGAGAAGLVLGRPLAGRP